MRVIREVEAGGRKVQVKELTLGEIRQWLAVDDSAGQDTADLLLEVGGITICDLYRFTDLVPGAVSNLTPSELEAVAEAAKELNPVFFRMLERVRKISERSAASSSAPSAS